MLTVDHRGRPCFVKAPIPLFLRILGISRDLNPSLLSLVTPSSESCPPLISSAFMVIIVLGLELLFHLEELECRRDAVDSCVMSGQ